MVTSQARLPAIFIGDAQALDFLNSIATPIDARVDWLGDGAGLLSWLGQAGLVPVTVLEHMRSQSSPGELNEVAERARKLREWFRGFLQERMGRPVQRLDLKKLEPLNRLLERDQSFSQIATATGPDSNALELQAMRRWSSPDALLLPIAASLAHLVCVEDFTCIKACEGPNCTLLFADHTRNRARRWCSMASCGNRAKQAAHRQRRGKAPPR